jgi:hypothetical protein
MTNTADPGWSRLIALLDLSGLLVAGLDRAGLV